jgi:hypothetical protein
MEKGITMHPTQGKVPGFSLKPHPVVSILLVFVFITGLLGTMSLFSMEEGTGEYRQKGILTALVTLVITICLSIVATAKLWFSHLWRKNSTHDRHKQHSRHHPVVKEQIFRKDRS